MRGSGTGAKRSTASGSGGSFTAALLDGEEQQRGSDEAAYSHPGYTTFNREDAAARKHMCGCLPSWGSTHMNLLRKNDVEKLVTYSKAWLALYGAIVVWYGGWTQLDVGFSQMGYTWANGTAVPERCSEAEVPYNPHRDTCYLLLGTGILIILDALYPNAGLEAGASVWPDRARQTVQHRFSAQDAGRLKRFALE